MNAEFPNDSCGISQQLVAVRYHRACGNHTIVGWLARRILISLNLFLDVGSFFADGIRINRRHQSTPIDTKSFVDIKSPCGISRPTDHGELLERLPLSRIGRVGVPAVSLFSVEPLLSKRQVATYSYEVRYIVDDLKSAPLSSAVWIGG